MMSLNSKITNLIRFKSFLANDIIVNPALKRQNVISKILQRKVQEINKSKLADKLRAAKGYYRLEMSPPKLGEIERLREDIKLMKEFLNSGCYKYLTVKQAWLLILVCTEVGLWFFMGETIGKMHIVGYKV